jgi:hypothetical protein
VTEAQHIIETLGLAPHPEGGWYRETWRGDTGRDGRAVGTAIYYLLEAGRGSRWHRVDAAEIWHWYAGATLELSLSPNGATQRRLWLGPGIAAGERPQALVPPGYWQSARSCGDFTLVGCTVCPGFEFSGFEMAPEAWEPKSD